MRTTFLTAAAFLGLACAQAFACEPTAANAAANAVSKSLMVGAVTDAASGFRSAKWDWRKFDANDHTRPAQPGENVSDAGADASQVETNYRVAQAEQTGVDNARLA